MRVLMTCVAVAAFTSPANAQTLAYRAQLTTEATATRVNTASPLVTPGGALWTTGGVFVAAASGSWENGDRVKLAGRTVLAGTDRGDVAWRASEGYVRVSTTPWMDVEAGKRLVRWGVGYGFSPAGVLDPPRIATDPTDRLGLNEGRGMAGVNLFRGSATLSVVAASSGMLATRARTVLHGGVDLAAIGMIGRHGRSSLGGTFTHVVGDRLEWHGEAIVQNEPALPRAVSAAAGLQYTFAAGVNVVLEYHRNPRGPGGSDFVFLRASRAAGSAVSPELILLAGLDDGTRILVPGLTWSPASRLELHARATQLLGGPRSIVRMAPMSRSITLGATLRF